MIIGVILTTINAISQLRVKLPQDLRTTEQKNTAFKAVGEIKKRMPEGPALLDPIKNMGITDKSFRDLIKVGPLWLPARRQGCKLTKFSKSVN